MTILWFASSTLAIVAIKEGLSAAFPYPLAMTALLNAIIALLSFSALRLRGKAATFDKRMVVLGALQGAEYCCGNMALRLLTLSYRTLLHATQPIFQLFAGLAIGIESPSCVTLSCILLLTGGAVICTWAQSFASLSWVGLAVEMAGCVCTALRWVVAQTLLQSEGYGSRDATVNTIGVTAVVAAVVAAASSAVLEDVSIASLGRAEGLVAIAVGAAVGVLLLAFAEYRLVGLTSALALSVLGTFHGMFFILAGVVFFGDTLTWRHFAGGCVILIGTLLFAFSRHSKAAKVLDAESTGLPTEPLLGAG